MLVPVEVGRQDNATDTRRGPNLRAGKGGHLGPDVAGPTEGGPVVQVIAAVGKEPPLDDVVGVRARFAADDAVPVVPVKDLAAEVVTGQK